MGGPKALVDLDGEPLVRRALRVLAGGGCAPLVVVLGAAADAVREVVPAGVSTVAVANWAEGMSVSLRAGLAALADAEAVPAALVHLVDLPGVSAAAIARLGEGARATTLRRAAYAGHPAHPVVLGRAHWAGVAAVAAGDAGARDYLTGHPDLELVECADVASPDDVDTPEALRRWFSSARPR